MLRAQNSRLEIVESDHESWDAYVLQHPSGSIFHTAAMIRAFAASCDMEPHAYAALDDSGKIAAMLVSCHVKTLRRFSSWSSRSILFAEPLCNPDPVGVAGLMKLVAMHDRCMAPRALMCEIRSIGEPGPEKQVLIQCNYEHRDYINFIVELHPDTEALWTKIDKQLRQKIRATLRKNIELRDDKSPAGVERLYGLLRSSYGRARVPLAGRELFEAVLEHLPPERVRLRTAFDGDRAVASIMSLVFGNRVFSWYGGTLRLSALSPFACIVWDDIVWGCENGFQLYDFGGAGWPHEHYGPRRFKASFGGKEIHFGRYLKTYSKLRLRLAELSYNAVRRCGGWSDTGK